MFADWTAGQTKNFNTAHQVIGIIVFIFILAQFVLGVVHHREYKKTQKPTKFAPIHVWMGRAAIILGVVNGFLYVFTRAISFRFLTDGLTNPITQWIPTCSVSAAQLHAARTRHRRLLGHSHLALHEAGVHETAAAP